MEDRTRDCIEQFEYNRRRFIGLNRNTDGVDIREGSEPAINRAGKEIKVTCNNCGEQQTTTNKHYYKCEGCRIRNYISAYDIEASEWDEEDW